MQGNEEALSYCITQVRVIEPPPTPRDSASESAPRARAEMELNNKQVRGEGVRSARLLLDVFDVSNDDDDDGCGSWPSWRRALAPGSGAGPTTRALH